MRLADFITAHEEAIVQEFEDFARTTGVGDAMTVDALRDHAAEMLEVIVAVLRRPQTATAQRRQSLGHAPRDPDAPATAAERHGHHRRRAHFTLDEAVAEFRALRASVLRLWIEVVGAPADEEAARDMIRFNEAVDQALAESTRRFSLEHERLHAEKLTVEGGYRDLFDNIDAGMCILQVLFDDDGTPVDFVYTETNPAFARHAGLTDVEGKRIRELVPEYDDYWIEVYGEVVRTGEPARREHYTPSFNRWFDVYAFRIGSPEECKVGVLFRDSTAQRQAEEALRESDRRKSEFLAMLSHELRSPLAAIRTSVGVLEEAGSEPSSLRTVAAILDRQSGALVRLVDDLLDVSRISLGKVDLDRRRVDLRRLVREVVNDAASMCEEKGIALSSTVPDRPLTVDADPVRLAQVVSNLVNNAVKYTPRDGEVHVTVERAGESARVRVSDTGVGMTSEQLGSVFEMFVQGERPADEGVDGLGIGLSLARSIAEMHGGGIEARSDGPGLGSEFLVTLPAARPEKGSTEGLPHRDEEALPGRPEKGRRVLVAEDNRDALQALALALRMKGHEVYAAADGEEAIRSMEVRRPEVALLDIDMPGLDGYGVARRVREAEWGRDMLLIAITGWGQEEDQQKAREAGFDRHVTKPADASSLDELIRSPLRAR